MRKAFTRKRCTDLDVWIQLYIKILIMNWKLLFQHYMHSLASVVVYHFMHLAQICRVLLVSQMWWIMGLCGKYMNICYHIFTLIYGHLGLRDHAHTYHHKVSPGINLVKTFSGRKSSHIYFWWAIFQAGRNFFSHLVIFCWGLRKLGYFISRKIYAN